MQPSITGVGDILLSPCGSNGRYEHACFVPAMPIFLDSPRHALGMLGFVTTPVVGPRILQIGAIASFVTLLHAGILYITGQNEASVPSQMVFLIVVAWLVIFGFFRLFATGALWFFAAVF